MNFAALHTTNGHQVGEVASAFQKSIRRGLVDDALYWGVDLYLTGYAEYAWKRMKIMTSEDVGIADRNLPAAIQALYQSFLEQKKKKDVKNAPERLFFVHAIILLATAPKNRTVDHALIYHFDRHAEAKREIPDYALDKHTFRGRKMNRGFDHFFDEGIRLENEVGADNYKELARSAMMAATDSVDQLFHLTKTCLD